MRNFIDVKEVHGTFMKKKIKQEDWRVIRRLYHSLRLFYYEETIEYQSHVSFQHDERNLKVIPPNSTPTTKKDIEYQNSLKLQDAESQKFQCFSSPPLVWLTKFQQLVQGSR